MASKADAEREAAALVERAIKDADKTRALADEEAKRLVAEAEKQAATIRQGAEDERIKKMMAQSPRRVELLQAIQDLEKRKGALKGEMEAHDRACLKERQAIARQAEKASEEQAAHWSRVISKATAEAEKVKVAAEVEMVALAARKAKAEEAVRVAERARLDAEIRTEAAQNVERAAMALAESARAAYGRALAQIEKLKKDVGAL